MRVAFFVLYFRVGLCTDIFSEPMSHLFRFTGNNCDIAPCMNYRSTAILLFTRSAQEEALHKPLSGKKRLNKRFFKELIDHTRLTAQSTGLPLFTADHQYGNTFGERLTNALKGVFDQGFDRVITIGNDSPGLTAEHLIHAANQLNRHDLVLGPSKDGGTYLIGIRKNAFDEKMWPRINWSAENSFRDLWDFAQQRGLQTYVGHVLQDIDNRSSIHALLSETGSQFRQLRSLVVSMLTGQIDIPLLENSYKQSPVRFSFGLKAPPLI